MQSSIKKNNYNNINNLFNSENSNKQLINFNNNLEISEEDGQQFDL